MPKALLIDPSRCTGCRACEAVCSLVTAAEVNPDRSRIRLQIFAAEYFYYPMVCAQCEIAYCALPCPTRALEKNYTTGVVDFVAERCIGCQMCVIGCPFGAITVRAGKASKCDLCGGDPTCVKFCEPKAIRFGAIEDFAESKRHLTAVRFKEAAAAVAGAPRR